MGSSSWFNLDFLRNFYLTKEFVGNGEEVEKRVQRKRMRIREWTINGKTAQAESSIRRMLAKYRQKTMVVCPRH